MLHARNFYVSSNYGTLSETDFNEVRDASALFCKTVVRGYYVLLQATSKLNLTLPQYSVESCEKIATREGRWEEGGCGDRRPIILGVLKRSHKRL